MYRYSERLAPTLASNESARLTAELRLAGASLLDLTSSNPTTVFATYPHERIRQAFASIGDFRYDPDPFGLPEARDAVVAYYRNRNITVNRDRLVLTASTSEAYALLFKLLCDPGDEVLIPVPSYPLFEYLAALECVRATPYHLRYDGSWYVDFTDMERKITSRTKAIVIVNPNNPTGSFLTTAERDRLLQLAVERSIPVIADEVFLDYAITPRSDLAGTLVVRTEALTFSLNGMSKVAGMPQVKLGWIVVNGPSGAVSTARERLEIVSDTYLSVGTPVAKALPLLLQAGEAFQKEIGARLLSNVRTIDRLLHNTPAHRLHMDGGWSAIVQLPGLMSEEGWILKLLREHRLLVQPGYFYDMPPQTYVVVSLLTEPAQMGEGMERLREAVTQS